MHFEPRQKVTYPCWPPCLNSNHQQKKCVLWGNVPSSEKRQKIMDTLSCCRLKKEVYLDMKGRDMMHGANPAIGTRSSSLTDINLIAVRDFTATSSSWRLSALYVIIC